MARIVFSPSIVGDTQVVLTLLPSITVEVPASTEPEPTEVVFVRDYFDINSDPLE